MEMQFNITGMNCAACVSRVENATKKVQGIESCSVSLVTNTLITQGTASEKDVIKAVKKAGYGITPKTTSSKPKIVSDNDVAVARRRFKLAGVLFLLIVYVHVGHVLVKIPMPGLGFSPLGIGIFEFVTAVATIALCWRFFVSGFKAAIHLSPNMDTLTALGSGSSFLYSTWLFVELVRAVVNDASSEVLYEKLCGMHFQSTVMLLLIISFGRFMEIRSKGKTTEAIKKLMELTPDYTVVLRNGEEVMIPIEELKVGDLFTARVGETIPADGVVVKGSCTMDESFVTGESRPIDKNVGDTVIAGTYDISGFILCEAQRVGNDSTASRIIKIVSDCLTSKAPISKTADKVAGIFVPVVLIIAVLVFVGWMISGAGLYIAYEHAASVLVISCPCALGLATPVAITVANGIAASKGILIKSSAILEEIGKADTVIFDKTGTLTYGKPVVMAEIAFDDSFLEYAVSLETLSEHPFGKAIVRYCQEEVELDFGKYCHRAYPKEVIDFKVHVGGGVSGTIDGKRIWGGSRDFVSKEANVCITDEMDERIDMKSALHSTFIYFAEEGRILGVFSICDDVKHNSPAAVTKLKEMGMRVIMATGDSERAALPAAEKCGIRDVRTRVMPEDKLKIVEEFQQTGKVIMVGDGINDAPALAKANVGIAVGTGADIAKDTADVVIVNKGLCYVSETVRLSRDVMRIIKQNIFWAFLYNIISIPIAAGIIPGFTLSPVIGAMAMGVSSFIVMCNALRLKRHYTVPKTYAEEQAEIYDLYGYGEENG